MLALLKSPTRSSMIPTFVRRASQARKPMITFLGKRNTSGKSEEPEPHPWAPEPIKKDFDHFAKRQAGEEPRIVSDPSPSPSSSGGSGGGDAFAAAEGGGGPSDQKKKDDGVVLEYASLWDMPSRYWRSRYAPMEEEEIELINGGGVIRSS